MSKVNIKLLIAAAAATSLLLTVPALTLPAFADSQAA